MDPRLRYVLQDTYAELDQGEGVDIVEPSEPLAWPHDEHARQEGCANGKECHGGKAPAREALADVGRGGRGMDGGDAIS